MSSAARPGAELRQTSSPSQGHRLGLVLPVDHPGRLFPPSLESSASNMTPPDVTATEVGARPQAAIADIRAQAEAAQQPARPIAPAIWLNGSRTTAWITFGAHRFTRKPRARSSAGIQTLKNILLENQYLPSRKPDQRFVDHYINQRYHESIGNVNSSRFAYLSAPHRHRRKELILTTGNRRLNHQRQAA